jgi:hypothetical protein
MFIGHFAVAFAARRAEPSVSLGTTVAAAQLCDILWPFFLLAGLEHVSVDPGNTRFTPLRFDSYPISHSLLTVVGWGLLFGGLHWAGKRRPRVAFLLAALVVSHWVLDFATHRPDMPLVPAGGPKVGLGLWNSVVATLVVEGLMFVTGVWLYVSGTRPRDGVGRYGLAAYVVFLVGV